MIMVCPPFFVQLLFEVPLLMPLLLVLPADITGIAAADIVHDFLVMLQTDAPPPPHVGPFTKSDLEL